jgi:hypothetical protein
VPRRVVVVVLSVLVGIGAQACDGQACTLIGGTNGIHVEIPSSLFVSSGEVAIEVCDADDCSSTNQRLGELPGDAPRPTGRGAEATFRALGRELAPGRVTVKVALHGPDGAIVATRQQVVKLSRSYPNGKECDGDGYVSGTLKMEPNDRV